MLFIGACIDYFLIDNIRHKKSYIQAESIVKEYKQEIQSGSLTELSKFRKNWTIRLREDFKMVVLIDEKTGFHLRFNLED